MLGVYCGFWEVWESNHKVKFDPINKLIHINVNVDYLDFRTDVYSAWKEWISYRKVNNMWQESAIRVVGGDPITADKALGTTYFLSNGWRIKPWDGHSHIMLNGNLYVDEGGRPIVPDNLGNDSVAMYTSNLIDNIIIDNTKVTDKTPPIWTNNSGIVDANQEDKFITIRWNQAYDSESEVYYNVYITDTYDNLWQSKLGTYQNNILKTSTEYDNITNLTSKRYYIGIRAIDEYGNETDNINFVYVDYIESTISDVDVNIVSVNGTIVDSLDDFKSDITNIDEKVNFIYDNTLELVDFQKGSWEVKDNQMIYYKVDGSVLATYNLTNDAGNPSMDEVFKRQLV